MIKPEDRDSIRRAAVILETLAEDCYERAQLAYRGIGRNRLMEKRAVLLRIVREMLEATDLIGSRVR